MPISMRLKAGEGASYSLGLASGNLIGVAANGPVWSCRWTSITHVALIHKVEYSFVVTTAYGTAQDHAYGLYFARAFTAADTGGTAATLTTNNGKHDTRFPTMLMTDIRIGTTDVITPGTRTLDAQFLVGYGGNGAAALAAVSSEEFNFKDPTVSAIVLRANEGLVLHNLIAMGATGVVKLRVNMTWTEIHNSLV
jgi:hypothetical protein